MDFKAPVEDKKPDNLAEPPEAKLSGFQEDIIITKKIFAHMGLKVKTSESSDKNVVNDEAIIDAVVVENEVPPNDDDGVLPDQEKDLVKEETNFVDNLAPPDQEGVKELNDEAPLEPIDDEIDVEYNTLTKNDDQENSPVEETSKFENVEVTQKLTEIEEPEDNAPLEPVDVAENIFHKKAIELEATKKKYSIPVYSEDVLYKFQDEVKDQPKEFITVVLQRP